MSTTIEGSFPYPAKLFEPGTEPSLQSHINYYSHFSLFGDKWDRYFKEELDYIKASPFGALYRLAKDNEFIWSGTLVHFLLANQLVTQNKYELWSLFSGKPIRFSLEEFGFIIGLSCDNYPTAHGEDRGEDNGEATSRWNRMLKSKSNPSLKDLEEMASECNEWTKEDRIRLAYLMILAGILLAKKGTCCLPRKYIDLVINIDRFERYPWGRAAFKVLVDSVHEVDLCNLSYTMNGFIQVLQIWGYESVSLIAKKVKAHAKSASDDSITLKWKGSRARVDFFCLEESTDKVEVNSFVGNDDSLRLMTPKWNDEVIDPLISNLVGAILVSTTFGKSIWIGHGIKKGPGHGETDDEILQGESQEKPVKKRKICRVEDVEGLTQSKEFVTRLYFDSCIEKLYKTMAEGFNGLSTNVEGLGTKVSELEKQVKTMQQKEPPSGKDQTSSSETIVRTCT